MDTLKKEIDEDDSGDIDFQEFLELMNSTTLRYKSSLNHPDKRTRSSAVVFEWHHPDKRARSSAVQEHAGGGRQGVPPQDGPPGGGSLAGGRLQFVLLVKCYKSFKTILSQYY